MAKSKGINRLEEHNYVVFDESGFDPTHSSLHDCFLITATDDVEDTAAGQIGEVIARSKRVRKYNIDTMLRLLEERNLLHHPLHLS